MAENVKQANFRIKPEDADAFRAFCEENGLQQSEGFSTLIKAIEINRAKEAVPNRQTEINEFETHINSILTAYLFSVELNENAEERIKKDFIDKLNSKDETIADYQKKNKELKERNEELLGMEQQLLTEQMAKATLKKEFDAFKEAQELLVKQHKDQMSDKDNVNVMLSEKLAAAEKKAERYDTLLTEFNEVKNALKDSEVKHSQEIKDLQHAHELALEKAARSEEDAVRRVKDEAAKTVEDIRRELIDKAETAQNDLLNTLRQHSEEVKNYEKEKIDFIRRISELEALNKE